jgi:A/G-specific adenine glycosylase
MTQDLRLALRGSGFCLYVVRVTTPHRRKISAIISKLLEWYRSNARDLPWRRQSDPYGTWISEIMLQQTQVMTVIPYWEKWIAALPNVGALASARVERIMKLWEGLGYYSRVRNAQAAAKIIVKHHNGSLPEKLGELLELPGIGRYTAGAICSIAFDQPTPILDGNVVRVLTRLFAIRSDPANTITNKRLWRIAEDFVVTADQKRVNGNRPCADLNQSLMELGALICTPATPKCGQCPVQKYCLASRGRCVHRIPRKLPKASATARRFVALALEDQGEFLVRRRPSGVINGRLWEFPNAEVQLGTSDKNVIGQLLKLQIKNLIPFCTIKHTITRYRMTLDVFHAHLKNGNRARTGKWATVSQLQGLAFSSAHKRIVQKLNESVS